MKVQIKSTVWIIERCPKVLTASYGIPITCLFERHENHLGWSGIINPIDAKEIFLIERK